MDTEMIVQILGIVLVLGVVWVLLRVVLKLAQKVFACGCSVILAIGVLIYLWQMLGNT